MSLLFLFLAFFFGINLSGAKGLEEGIGYLVCLLFILPIAFHNKAKLPFLSGAAAGIMLGLVTRIPAMGYMPKVGVVIRTSENYFIFLSGFDRFYVSSSNHAYEVGDILKIEGEINSLNFTTYESRFDFASYLASMGVRGEISWKKNGISTLFATPVRLKTYENYCLSSFSNDAKALISACLFNRKDSKNVLMQRLENLNLLFLFSSSGLVASFFLQRAEKLLWYRFSDEQAKMATCVISFLLCILSPYKIGLWRIFIGRLFTLINIKKKLGFKSYELTCASGIFLLLLNPNLAFQSAFLIGYGASLYSYFANGFFVIMKKSKQPIPRFLLFQFFLFPVMLTSNKGVIHLLGPAFTFVFAPFACCYILLGGIALLGLPLIKVANALNLGLSGVLSFFEKFDATFTLFPAGTPFLFAFYILAVGGSFLYQMGQRKNVLILAVVYVSSYFASFLPIVPAVTQEVSFINVGQGDSILIRDGLHAVLLDTGGNLSFDMAKESLIPYFRKKRIYKIDCLIASHGDFDHIGAKDSLMENFKVLKFASSPSDFPLKIGGITLNNLNSYGHSEENESSLVLTLDFMGTSFLFTGDATTGVEKEILEDNPNLRCDVLKVGHHGSSTSTCEEWLDAIKPKEAVISCGAKNKYGHPDKEVLSRLDKRGIKIRRTDLEGTITYARLGR